MTCTCAGYHGNKQRRITVLVPMFAIVLSCIAVAISLITAIAMSRKLRRIDKRLRRLKHLQREPDGRDMWPPS